MKNKALKLGLIGTGRIGRIHAANMNSMQLGSIVAVTDYLQSSAEECAELFSIPKVCGNSGEIFEDPEIDAVLICSSTDTHLEFIEKAANCGKHIFCEKPLGLELSEIDRVLEIVAVAKVKLQLGFNRRFDPDFKRARDMIVEGKIGTPHLIRITSRDPEPPPIEYVKVSGGIFLDMTIHDFDMARYLAGSEVVEVFATGSNLIDPAIGEAGDLDTACITLKFENGAIATIDNSRQTNYGYDQRLEVFGLQGVIKVENTTPHGVELSNESGVHASLPHYFFLERYADSYRNELSSFLEAVASDKPILSSGADGRVALLLGLAAKRSIEEKRAIEV